MDASADRFAGPAAAARRALVRRLTASGELRDPGWRAAFEEVPRHVFVPYYFAGFPGSYERLWCEDPSPARRERWLRGVYADVSLVTRVRDGTLLSSSSQPSVMARMLEELRVRDGCRVLEIGAGTGYNAALLCHRLGDSLVTTVDLDPDIVESARAHLAAVGYRPALIIADGARGCPERAPFDRIISTCSLASVPWAWPEQCRPGGRILAPLATGLIALDVFDDAEHGRMAQGRFLRTPAHFMPLRGGPAPRSGVLPRRAVKNDLFRFLLNLTEGSLDPQEALSLWERERRPERDRYGVTVCGGRQWSWLDDPEGPYAWPVGPPQPPSAVASSRGN
ncbi:methyltransferase domain-containing protein [Streptomyces sp. HNM0663]|uniref:Protein-L-isoaspartate O-methyltransferase n=1 Tax=Streptomyces chengmaiensis TaxID=3040919 RepID=A0ABT6I0M4_9ACTN|nr:methyltransferase domain-containing protein [Streptomyces chengmaiensis]MDH2393969.1 methyltransferase domain-containing protein [Streptomyces chengmaiensis]